MTNCYSFNFVAAQITETNVKYIIHRHFPYKHEVNCSKFNFLLFTINQ